MKPLLLRKSGMVTLMMIVSLICAHYSFGQITFVDSEDNTATESPLVINKPANVQIGDIMIANIVQVDNDNATLSDATSNGWTFITGRKLGENNGGGPNASQNEWWGTLLYKIATAGDLTTGSYDFNLDNDADDAVGGIVAFRGVDNINPFDVAPGTINLTNSDDLSATSITTVTANAAVVMFGMDSDNENYSLWQTVNTDPGTLNEILDEDFDATLDMSVGAAWDIKVNAGGTGTGIGTAEIENSTSNFNGAILIALRPCAATTAAPVITVPLCSGVTTVSGTSSEADGTTIQLFRGSTSIGTTTVSSGSWSITGISPALAAGNVITAMATASDKCISGLSSPVTVLVTPSTPGTISGPTPVCPAIPGTDYSVTNVAGVTYHWEVPAGWTITSGQTTNSIAVTTGGVGQNGNITVTASNACGTSSASILPVAVVNANDIGFNGDITLNSLTVCQGTTATIVSGDNPTGGQNYQWQVDDNPAFSSPANAAGATDNNEDYTIDNDYYDNPGTYYFRRIISNNSNCNGPSDVVTFIVIPSAAITTTGTLAPLCFSDAPQSASLAYSATTGNPTSYSIDWASGINDQETTPFSFAAGGGTLTNIQVQLGAPAGTHNGTLTITNDAGCSATRAISITIAGPPSAVQTITGPVAVCSVEGGLIYSVPLQMAPGATYFWTVPAGWSINSGQNTNSITVTSGNIGQSGNIGVTVTNSCSPTSGVGSLAVGFLDDIGYGGVPTANSSTTCAGVAPIEPIIGGNAPQGPNYQWQVSINGGAFGNAAGNDNDVDYFISPTYFNSAGTYRFRRVISSSTTACNGNSDEVTLTVLPVPTVAALTGIQTICAGSTTTFSSTTPGGVWGTSNSAVATVNDGLITGVSGGSANISYTVTGPNGCPTAVVRSVTVIASPTSVTALPLSSTICFPDNVNLTGSANVASPVSLLSENFNNTGTLFSVAGTTTGGSVFTQRPSGYIAGIFQINNNDGSQFMIADAASFGTATTSSTLTTSPVINTTGFTSLTLTFRHSYDKGSEAGVSVQVSTDPGNTVWTTVTQYTTAQGSANNFVQATIDLTDYINEPNFRFRYNFISTVTFNVSWWAIDDVQLRGTPEVYYSWAANTAAGVNGLPAGAGTPSTTNNNITVDPSATTTYTLTVTANGCSGTSAGSVVTVNQPPAITGAIDQTICGGDDVLLSVNVTGTGALPVTWSSSSGNDAGFSNIHAVNPSYTPSVNDIGNKTVTLTVVTQEPSGPCVQDSKSIVVAINTPAFAFAGDDMEICYGDHAFPEGGRSGATSSTWTTDGDGKFLFNSQFSLGPEYEPGPLDRAAGSVKLTLTTNDPDGPCTAASDFMTLTIRPQFTAGEINSTGETICDGGDPGIIGNATAASGGDGNITYKWQANGSDIAGANGPTFNPPAGVFGTTVYTRFAKDGTCNTTFTQSAGSWTVVLYPSFTAGEINSTGEQICTGGDPATIGSATAASGGDGNITYKWQANGVDIASSNSATYNPPAGLTVTTTYTRFAKDGTCNPGFTQSTGSWTVTVNPVPVSGTLTKTPDQAVVCEGTNVSATLTAGSGGVAGTTTDVLQYRYNGGTWYNYTSGSDLSTTGKSKVEIQTYRTSGGSGCTTSTANIVTWNVNQGPTVTNNKSTQTLVYGAPLSVVTVTANDGDSPGSDLVIDAVSYTYNGGSSISGLPEALSIIPATTGTNSRTWTVEGCMKGNGPGTYEIKVAIKDNCGVSGYTTFKIYVNPGLVAPVADAYYTGATFFWTTGPSSSTATLTLAATVKNVVDNCADIRMGRVSFYVRGATGGLTPINGAQNLPVGLIDPDNLNVGAASAIVQYNIGNLTMCPLNIAVKVTGSYLSIDDPSTDKQITIAVPLPGGQIVGGGTLDNFTSSGYIGGTSSKKTEFSIEVKFNKSLTNPQGRIELTICSKRNTSGVVDGKLHIYKVKSTAISTLVVNKPTIADAQFSSKVNVTEILANGSSVGVESGIPFVLDLYDGNLVTGSPKPPDKLGITIYRKNGGVWYSNNWDVNKTVMKEILDGVVSAGPAVATKMPVNDELITKQNVIPNLKVPTKLPINEIKLTSADVWPNPATSHFNVRISSHINATVELRMYDMKGNMIQMKRGSTNEVFRFGDGSPAGTYIIEARQQGINDRKTIRVIKVN